MKKNTVFFTFLLVCSSFVACNNTKTIKVTSAPAPKTTVSPNKTVKTTVRKATPVSHSTTTSNEYVVKEELLVAEVKFLLGDDLDAALVKAKAEKKPVFVDFYADWCAPCKVMEESVFKDYDIADYLNNNVVSVRVNVDKGKGNSLKQKMYVSALPTLLFLDPNGNEIMRKESLPLIEEFKKIMKTATWKVKNPTGQP